jgi:hypothetical protein
MGHHRQRYISDDPMIEDELSNLRPGAAQLNYTMTAPVVGTIVTMEVA